MGRYRPPKHPRPDARATALGIDLDLVEALHLHQDRVGQVTERAGIVARALRGDSQPVRGSEADGGRDVLSAGRDRDGVRALVDGQVPGLPGAVPPLVGRGYDFSCQLALQVRVIDLRRLVGHSLPSF